MSRTYRRRPGKRKAEYVDAWMKPDNIYSFSEAQALFQNSYTKYIRRALPMHLWSKSLLPVDAKALEQVDIQKVRKFLSAMFHADRRKGWSPPAGFRRQINRDLRARNKHELQSYLAHKSFEEDLVSTPFVRDCRWFWW